MELLKTEVDLENMMSWLIGAIALEFAAFIYYGEMGLVLHQLVMAAIGILTIYVVYPLVYARSRKQRFKDLEEQFITKKRKEDQKRANASLVNQKNKQKQKS